jgi:hypothetical protein
LRTPQRPQPVFDPNMICVHFTYSGPECTHFAWPIHTYVVTSAHTLLGPGCCKSWNYLVPTHTLCVHTVLGPVVLLYIYTLVQSLFYLGLCTQLHCTIVHSLVPAWPLYCQPITEELWFTCFALIGPSGVPTTDPPLKSGMLTQPSGCVKNGFYLSCFVFWRKFSIHKNIEVVLHLNIPLRLSKK